MSTRNFTAKKASGVGYGDNVAVVGQAFGQPVRGLARANAPSNDNAVQPAGLFSTAPYTRSTKPVGHSVSLTKIEAIREDVIPDERYNRCFALEDTCMSYGTVKYNGLCNAHGRMALGLGSFTPKGE